MQQTRSPYQIAMLQMNCDLFHVSNNLDKAEKQIREAAAHGAKLICLPEVFNVGYLGTCIPDMMKLAEIEDGPSLTRMRSLAKELSVFILAPILFSTPSGVENSAFLIDDTGTILGHYSKTHPVGDERTYLQRGTQYPVFETKDRRRHLLRRMLSRNRPPADTGRCRTGFSPGRMARQLLFQRMVGFKPCVPCPGQSCIHSRSQPLWIVRR